MPTNGYNLWTMFSDQFYDVREIISEQDRSNRINIALSYINDRLCEYGLYNEKFGLPMPDLSLIQETLDIDLEALFFPPNIGSEPLDLTSVRPKKFDYYSTLNRGQKHAVDTIEKALESDAGKRLFFLHGSGGW